MADGTPQVAPSQPTHRPPFTAEETEIKPTSPRPESESVSVTKNEPPLAMMIPPPTEPLLADEEKLKEPTEPPPADEEKLKEAVTVVERETPLTPAPLPDQPLTVEHVSITAMPTPPISQSQPLSSALATTQESESPKPPKEEAMEPDVSKKKAPESTVSFKEESNIFSDLSNLERRALVEFRKLIQEALNKRLFSSSPSSETSSSHEEVSIWGVPLLKDDRSDVILLKFLRARDFKVNESFTMLKNTIQWRRTFNVDELIKEDLGDDLEMVVFMRGQDKEGHPVCYNVYGEFQNKELYAKTFADEEKRLKFIRWRIQFLERSLRKLDFNPGGINTIFQVSDLKNSPGPGKRELRIATKQALQILQDNYPEVVAKQVFINVPWWHLAFYTMISPFLTQRAKSKFLFAGPSKTAETLLKYISPEQLPIQYGGLSVDFCECNPVFTIDDPLTEITVKPVTKQTVEIIVNEKCTIFWELRVVNWEVSYGAEYVPEERGGYSVIIQRTKKMAPTDEPVMSNSFPISKLGKILLTVDNPTAKKKKLLYRFKVMPYED